MMKVNRDRCIGCGECIKDCFVDDIMLINGKAKIKNEACFKCCHCIAVCPVDAVSTDEYDLDDVKEYNEDEFSISTDNLLNFIKFRRSIRQFKDKKVEKNKILKIIEAARFTPTAGNQQDLSFTVVDKNINKFKELILEKLNEKGKYILNNLNSETIKVKRYAEMWLEMYQDFKNQTKTSDRLFFNAPTVILVSAKSNINAGLASANMELLANTLDLGVLFSGFTLRAAKDDKKIRNFLKIEAEKELVTVLIIGYPDVKYFRTVPRKKADISWK
ncbi:MAG: nitroreductase [Halanaerobium sp. 4-GBenrich]|jgi:nitroreductase/NAD-dependent dihydropyrimidine dehydrogenase PreA subunit|uniref:nitroreductase family protein n=1 Tax=Halanaerobium congolense TaxID=54121 RepID=UPI00079130AD|nr:nitroreductase family protein [Halanaerobium congolense]KXS48105.1 MAG: nitroreductase [Halanaerobium sp. T82-1]ODS50965.1 MAG: nitroreductase [Halanaerobium sp. 4-GBenrich]SDH21637.1 Nitroreductase [Halanaerobium congolense]SHM68335.1 Nitroreductase [Halanaerobium congolense]